MLDFLSNFAPPGVSFGEGELLDFLSSSGVSFGAGGELVDFLSSSGVSFGGGRGEVLLDFLSILALGFLSGAGSAFGGGSAIFSRELFPNRGH